MEGLLLVLGVLGHGGEFPGLRFPSLDVGFGGLVALLEELTVLDGFSELCGPLAFLLVDDLDLGLQLGFLLLELGQVGGAEGLGMVLLLLELVDLAGLCVTERDKFGIRCFW